LVAVDIQRQNNQRRTGKFAINTTLAFRLSTYMKKYLSEMAASHYINFPVLSLFLLAFCIESHAAEPVISEEYYLQEFPVVLGASRLPQPLPEAPNAMTVIDRNMIKASGFRNIADLFRLVPGMYVSYNAGHEPIVAYHGTTDNLARRMQVLVDGRSVFLPPIGAVTWENLPLQIDDIERIEVIRGPAAASHGGNSTQGVLNIITRDAAAMQGFKASVTEGNGGISDAAMHVGQRGELLDYRLTLGYRSDYGYDKNPNAIKTKASLNNDSHQTKLFNLRSNYHPSAVDSLDIQLGYTDGTKGTGLLDDPNVPHDLKNSENFEQITWLRSLSGGDDFKLQYYHIYRDEMNLVPPAGVYPEFNDSYTVSRDDLEIQHTLHTSSNNRLVWGASVRHDWIRATARFLEEQNLQQTTLFAHDEWRMSPNWLLNTGAMQEDNGLGQKNLSPRIALIYKFVEHQTVRAGWSKAYRNPSVYEERGNYHFLGIGTIYQANGGLRPESVLSREIGYLGEFPEQGFSVDARLYHDELSDIIYESENTPKDFINLFDAEHNGLEITTKHQWGDRNQLTFNYAYQLLSSNVALSYAGAYSESMPRNMISALYSTIFNDRITLSLGYYQQDSMLPIDRPARDRQSFSKRWDMKIAKGFKLDNSDAETEVALVVQGLFDEHYIDYQNGNRFNQRVFLTATLRY